MRGLALIALCAPLCPGCSLAFMSRPPSVVAAPNYPVECTTSYAAPVLDTVCASYFVLNAAALAGGAGNYDSNARGGGILLSGGLAVLCAVSAGIGYSSASRCSEVKDENNLCMSGNIAACTRLRPDWRPPPGARAAPVAEPSGCAKDTDCKGDRVCERGACVSPAPRPPPAVHRCEHDADCDRGVCMDGVCHE